MENSELIPVEIQHPLEEKSLKIIGKYTIAASAGGLIPISILSIAATTGIQVAMIRELCALYEVPFENKMATVAINSGLGSLLTRALAVVATTMIPGSGTSMKGLTGAGIAGLYTATVGEFYKVHFQKGGTLINASITDIKDYFIEEYRRGDISMNSLTNPVGTLKRLVLPSIR